MGGIIGCVAARAAPVLRALLLVGTSLSLASCSEALHSNSSGQDSQPSYLPFPKLLGAESASPTSQKGDVTAQSDGNPQTASGSNGPVIYYGNSSRPAASADSGS